MLTNRLSLEVSEKCQTGGSAVDEEPEALFWSLTTRRISIALLFAASLARMHAAAQAAALPSMTRVHATGLPLLLQHKGRKKRDQAGRQEGGKGRLITT